MCQRHGVDLAALIAETALWANPEVHRRLLLEHSTGAFFPGMRRARTSAGEQRGQVVDGDRLDDNSGANQAIKKAVCGAVDRVRGFEACHLWPGTAYDARFHTVIPNLVLLPRALAGLSDHDPHIGAVLRFRSYELYGWRPEHEPAPEMPDGYPSSWREPEPWTSEIGMVLARRAVNRARPRGGTHRPSGTFSDLPAPIAPRAATLLPQGAQMPADERTTVVKRIRRWANNPGLKVHRILGLIVRTQGALPRQQLAQAIERETGSTNGYGAIANLLSTEHNSYGRALIEVEGTIRLHPDVRDEILAHRWS